jgi:hypothetical protein
MSAAHLQNGHPNATVDHDLGPEFARENQHVGVPRWFRNAVFRLPRSSRRVPGRHPDDPEDVHRLADSASSSHEIGVVTNSKAELLVVHVTTGIVAAHGGPPRF